ncbi:MAG: undecaprenyldiphospho-muramoylpentapeptide beta-N-acetylglucosaminyltransferase [Candidatus Cloacimonadales bacterium]
MKKIIVAAGGTGGHIIPALSIASALKKRGWQVLYVGNLGSLEEKLAAEAGFEFAGINVQKLYRHFTFSHLRFPFKLLKSIADSQKIIKRFQPDLVLGTGGFVSGPVGYAAHRLGIPLYLQEQNSYPGLTTRILSKYAESIFLGSTYANKFLPTDKTVLSGNPINCTKSTKSLDLSEFGFRPPATKLFLLGGSQGSLALNKAIYPILDQLYENEIDLIWQIGKYSYEEFLPKIAGRPGLYAFSFTSEINALYEIADFALARGGALSLAELEVNKLPTVIVPLPSAAGNHQYYNALDWKIKHIGKILQQKDLNPDKLLKKLLEMKNNLTILQANFSLSLHQNAAETIAEMLIARSK